MFIPPYFREDSLEALHEIIRQEGFGVLISQGPKGLATTHLPFLLDTTRGEKGVLLAHMARANEHWQHLEAASELLVIFSGPHTYISPSWYTTRQNVPTWNYVAVHARGRARLLGEEGSRDVIARLSAHYEQSFPHPWSVREMPEAKLQGLVQGIVGFEIEITQLIGQKKLSQNRSAEDRSGVIQGLKTSNTPHGLAVAALMERKPR